MRALRAAMLTVTMLGLAPAARADRPYTIPFTPEWAAPQLDAFPISGPPGTEVQIGGHKFHRDVAAFFGDQPMTTTGRGKAYIVAFIPQVWGHDDFIYVVDETGRARTRYVFDVFARRRHH